MSKIIATKKQLKRPISKALLMAGGFANFIGLLDKNFKTNDKKYWRIIKF